MRIIVDFIAARQEWNPDTGEQQNYLVMEFAGREYTFAVTESELVSAVQAAKTGERPEAVEVGVAGLSELNEMVEDSDLSEQAEDVPVRPPAMFQSDPGSGVMATDISTDEMPGTEPARPQEPSASVQRKASIAAKHQESPARQKLKEMRERAKSVPHRRVESDEMGYPVVSGGGNGAPEVEITRKPVIKEIDEDGFGQA